ncbi:MAG: hypothetical protein ABI699_07105 [Caldimonas sp.]
MKSIVRIAFALTTLAACAAASAEPYDQADQERRARNREEAIAKHGDSRVSYQAGSEERTTLREKTHRAADKTRSFTHRQAEKMRRFGERQNRRYGTPAPAIDTQQRRSP